MTGPIERLLHENSLARKRYLRFKKNRAAVASVLILGFLLFLSVTAEFWANSKPHLIKYQGRIFAPLIFDYHPTEFGRDDIFVMDYRALKLGPEDWVVWPLVQWDPLESNKFVETYPAPPSEYNLFGTDDRGRDVLARLLYGLRYTFTFALGSWILTYLVGCAIGAAMGYWGGTLDLVGQRVVEVIESVPQFFVIIILISIFTPSLPLLIIFMMFFDWTIISAYMRGQFLQMRKREYVEAARAIGAGHMRIVFKHIFPNALTPLVTFSPFAIAGNVLMLANMDYLGLGLRAPTPSWGELLAQAQKYFTIAEWLVWAPSGVLLLTLTLLINIGLAVRNAYDAKAI